MVSQNFYQVFFRKSYLYLHETHFTSDYRNKFPVFLVLSDEVWFYFYLSLIIYLYNDQEGIAQNVFRKITEIDGS